MSADIVSIGRVPEWSFGDRLRKVRRDMNWTQPEMADALGVPEPRYSAWETGRTSPRDIANVSSDLERLTGVTRIWFLGWADGKTPTEPEPDGGIDDERARRYSKPQPSDPKVRPLLAVA